MARDCFFKKYQSSYISFKTILYPRWGHCEHLKWCSVTEANPRHAANKCLSADPILHRQPLLLKNHSMRQRNLKIKKVLAYLNT
jgi:hypothetical protein